MVPRGGRSVWSTKFMTSVLCCVSSLGKQMMKRSPQLFSLIGNLPCHHVTQKTNVVDYGEMLEISEPSCVSSASSLAITFGLN